MAFDDDVNAIYTDFAYINGFIYNSFLWRFLISDMKIQCLHFLIAEQRDQKRGFFKLSKKKITTPQILLTGQAMMVVDGISHESTVCIQQLQSVPSKCQPMYANLPQPKVVLFYMRPTQSVRRNLDMCDLYRLLVLLYFYEQQCSQFYFVQHQSSQFTTQQPILQFLTILTETFANI